MLFTFLEMLNILWIYSILFKVLSFSLFTYICPLHMIATNITVISHFGITDLLICKHTDIYEYRVIHSDE